MIPPATFALRIAVFLLALARLASADSPPLLTTGVEIGSSNERTALNRATRNLSSTVDVKIKNTSDRLLEAPLHAVISFTPQNGGNLAGLTMPNTPGGIGTAPYQTFYKDLSASIGNGLAAGGETSFSFTFERPAATTVTYAVSIRGIRNTDPVASVGGPYFGQQGAPLAFNAGASSDPDGDALTFTWDFGDGTTAEGANPSHTFESSGIYTVILTATDARGAAVSREIQVPISPPGIFALARTRTLDGNGHPLGDVTITQSGPDGSHPIVSDSISGFASLGGAPGDHSWSFERSGYLTSFRKSTLQQGQVKVVPFPWLTAINTDRITLSLLISTPVNSPNGLVTLTMPTGAFDQVQSVAITELHGQSLPLPLPFGWSPLSAFHLDMPGESAVDIPASLKLLQPLATTQTAVLAWMDTTALAWKSESLITGTSADTLAAVLRKPGTYAVVIADTLTTGNPATAQIGLPLPAGTAPTIAAEVTAIGQVNPAVTVASLDPAKVTAQATVDFTNHTQSLTSGAWFLADVGETYDLRDGQLLKTPDYDATFYAYQNPGDTLAPTATANFPLRPRLLYGPDQLTEAHIKVDVLSLNRFTGGIITPDGGKLSIPGVQVTVPPGAVRGPTAAEVRPLSPTKLAGFLGGFQSLLAFEINLPPLADGSALDLAIAQKLTPGSNFVLARCVSSTRESGLQPVLRLRSDAQGQLSSAEPATGQRLPGITGSGQYVIVQITDPAALVTGLVRKVGGSLLPGALVRAIGEPWLSLTGNTGTFFTLAKPGQRTLTGTDPADGNSGQATATLADAAATANVEIQTAATGPRVVATTPAAGATKVNPSTPITVRFSEPLDLASFGPTAMNVTNPHGVVVIGSVSLNLAGTEATFLPINPLEQAAHYTVELAATIRDRTGLPIEGPRSFTFAVIPFFERPPGAQLVIYEPDAKNVPQAVLDQLVGYNPAAGVSMVVATGSPGTADPEVPVILINEDTGETATVLSKPDGSFSTFIHAEEEHIVSSAFVNANGTVVTAPAKRQLFDNGRVGLYEYGGILEAQSDGGPVQIQIEPNTIERRSVFKVDLFSVAQLAARTGGVLPEGGVTALPGVSVVVEGDAPKGDAEVSFPLDPSTLGLDAGLDPKDAAFALLTPVDVNGEIVYLTLDKMRFENGRLFTNTCPFKGVYNPSLGDDVVAFATNFLGPVGSVAVNGAQIIVPALLANAVGGVTINGSVAQLPMSNVKRLEDVKNVKGVSTLTILSLTAVKVVKGKSLAKNVSKFIDGLGIANDLVALGTNIFEEATVRGVPAVQGALIALRPQEDHLDGRIKPGMVCAVSDENGCYSLVAPTLSGFRLVGTHPRLGRSSDVQLGISDYSDLGAKAFLARNIFFGVPDNQFLGLVPRILTNHSPYFPAVGDTVTLTVDVFTSANNMAAIRIADGAATKVETLILGQTVKKEEDLEITEPNTETISPGHRRFTTRIKATKSLLATIRIIVEAEKDQAYTTTADENIRFGFSRPSIPNELKPADPNDEEGPVVVSTNPTSGSYIYPGQPILIKFSEPVHRDLLTMPSPVSFNTSQVLRPTLALSQDQQTLSVYPLDLPSGGEITMTVTKDIQDLAANPLKQTYTTTFQVEEIDSVSIPGVTNGGGSFLDGNMLYVLERGDGGMVRIFDAKNPRSPIQISTIKPQDKPSAINFPRDLLVIKDWSHVPGLNGPPPLTAKPSVKRPLLVVVGGAIGSATINNNGGDTQNGQHLTIYDVTDPANPSLVTNVQITARSSSVPKLRWYPPNLVYLENSADTHFVSFVDLQELLSGFSVLAVQRQLFFKTGQNGEDIDKNGSYEPEKGEKIPWPQADKVTEFFGFKRGLDVFPLPRQRIEDFDFDPGTGTLAVVRSMSGLSAPIPATAKPEFRLVEVQGQGLPVDKGFVVFEPPARPKRTLLVPRLLVKMAGNLELRNLAFVSLSPDSDGKNKLSVIDYTDAINVKEIRKISLGDELGVGQNGVGAPQSPVLRPDGLIALSTTKKVVLISPVGAFELAASGSQPHPSIVGILPNGGSGNFSNGVNVDGAHSVALGGRNELTMGVPALSFVSFPSLLEVFEPSKFPPPDASPAGRTAEQANAHRLAMGPLRAALKAMRTTTHVRPARFKTASGVPSALSPPSPLLHYHVLIQAPGDSGNTIDILLESLNVEGKAERNKGEGYPPVRAAVAHGLKAVGLEPEAGEAPVISLQAHRLSNDYLDPEYNQYITEPFVVVREKMKKSEIEDLQNEMSRVILYSEANLRASLDITVPAPISDFAAVADADNGLYRPKAFALATTLPGTGCGGPPVGGELAIPGTFGAIEASTGEFRHSTVDLELPSPRMPIVFERTAATHAGLSSAFGIHWDFNYNQRAVEMSPELVPPGERQPVQQKEGEGKDVVAESKDIIFINGAGHAIVFKNKGKTAPPGVADDPILPILKWDTAGGEYFMPADTVLGVFDIMYRFPSGEVVRVTPDGTQFHYRKEGGKLVKITDRYPANSHVLEYNKNGDLIKIIDKSVDQDRFIRLGYFRKSESDETFDSDVDQTADKDKPKHVGRICQLKDSSGRVITFEYDDQGYLTKSLGVQVAGDNGGFKGRPSTSYQLDQKSKAYVGIIAGNGAHAGAGAGTPLVSAILNEASSEKAVPKSATGAGGNLTIDLPPDRSQANISKGSTKADHADASKTEIKYDDNGYPASVKMSGTGAAAATYSTEHNSSGLPETITYPEGNTVTYSYESGNFRSRGNVRSITRSPGGRGGVNLTATFNYDPRYNLPAGAQTDFNGKTFTITLDADGRDAQKTEYPQAGTHKITRNTHGQVTEETTVEGVKTTYVYDPLSGFPTSRKLGSDVTTTFAYDATIPATLGMPTTITPPRGTLTTITYDDRQQRTKVNRGAQEEKTAYDENGNVIFLSRKLGDAGTDYIERRKYSQINFLEELKVEGVEEGGTLVTTFAPDPVFRVDNITLPGGEIRKFKYDHLGNVTEMTLGGYKEIYGRDLHGNMTSLKKGEDEVQTILHDGHDRAQLITNKTGGAGDEVTSISYFGKGEVKTRTVRGEVGGEVAAMSVTDVDELGRPLSLTVSGTQATANVSTNYREEGGLKVTTTGPVDITSSTHDNAGRPTKQQDSLRTVTITPDGNGNVTKLESVEEGTTYTQDMVYNDLDQLTKRIDPVGTLMDVTSLRLDGLPLEVKDGRNKSTIRNYSRLGELLTLDRPENIRFAYAFDKNRQPASVMDRDTKGNVSTYDATLRRTKSTWRDGSETTFDLPDGRNLPTSITIPGGSITAEYDLQGRPTKLETTYDDGDYIFENATYDAMGRLRSANYGSDGQFSLTMGYDKLGPLTSCTYDEPGGPFTVSTSIRADGARLTLDYPSGVTVTETRENSGRLTKVEVDEGSSTVWNATGFAGAELPQTIKHGQNITETCTYDERKRLLTRRYTGAAGALLEEIRLGYDGADNVTSRQLLAGGGRADIFDYDDANRLTRAEYGARPDFEGANRSGTGLLGDEEMGLAKGWYARSYNYDTGGLDLMRGGALINPDAIPPQLASLVVNAIPSFASDIDDHDDFLFAQTVDGFSRGAPDDLGNTARSQFLVRPPGGVPVLVAADLTYNGRSNLIQVSRGDGVTIDYQYRPDNLIHHRRVSGGISASETAYVWHEGRLLEEYSLGGSTTLRARYYYANGDAPVAADLRQGNGNMLRVHYLHDQVMSVVAVADDSGHVIERVRYDAWGQPVITTRDTLPPQVAEVRQDGNSLLVTLSEPVLPLINEGTSSVETATSHEDAFKLSINGNAVTPQIVFEEGMAPFGSVFRLTGIGANSGNAILTTVAGKLQDTSGNVLLASSLGFPIGSGPVPGSATIGSTVSTVSRTAIENPFLFHGQYFDYDAGLSYMRARFYDPSSGAFLQRDPMQYEDSVNLYAGFAHNPTSLRDPSGRKVNLESMKAEDRQSLIMSLAEITGLDLVIKDEELQINEKSRVEPKGKFSRRAQAKVKEMIEDERVLEVSSAKDWEDPITAALHIRTPIQFGHEVSKVVSSDPKKGKVFLDFEDLSTMEGAPKSRQALSAGFVFLHEAIHYFEDELDAPTDENPEGNVERYFINPIREEMGLPMRAFYGYSSDRGKGTFTFVTRTDDERLYGIRGYDLMKEHQIGPDENLTFDEEESKKR